MICLVVSLDASMLRAVGEVVIVGESNSRYKQGLPDLKCPFDAGYINHMHSIRHQIFTTEPRTRNHIFIQHLNLSSSEASELIASFTSSLTAALLSHG
jgi:hypothetical protein